MATESDQLRKRVVDIFDAIDRPDSHLNALKQRQQELAARSVQSQERVGALIHEAIINLGTARRLLHEAKKEVWPDA